MIETKEVQATPENDKVINPEFNYGTNLDGTSYGTVYVRENIKQIEVNQGTEEEPRMVKMWQYDEKQYTFEEYVVELDTTTKAIKQDNETTKGALDTLMQVVMTGTPVVASDEPTPALMAVEGIDNTKQKGADNIMAAYIAKRVIDLEAQQEGAGKAYYKLYLSSALWGTYKEDIDFILADLGRADLIVEL